MKYRDAISEIKTSVLNAHEAGAPSPLFFMAGSGISTPSISLAAEMTKDLKEKARLRGHKESGPLKSDKAYSYWFEKAFPSAIERSRYLRTMMGKKSVSQANFSLAKLLALEQNGRPFFEFALTTNFDDFLSRSLAVFGVEYYTHSHPVALDRVDLEQSYERQIVHLHGSFKFYDCHNTLSEIAHTGDLPEVKTAKEFLIRLMPNRMPIVVGYGGWESDVFMRTLSQLFKSGRLPRNAYWFCHTSKDALKLPKSLRSHPNFKLIIPKTGTIDANDVFDDIANALPSSSFKTPRGGALALAANLLGAASDENLKDRDEPLRKALDEAEKSGEITFVGPPWTDVLALLEIGFPRLAWVLINTGNLMPVSDFHKLTLLEILDVVSGRLSYDADLTARVTEFAKTITVTHTALTEQAEKLIASINNRATRDHPEKSGPSSPLNCSTCASTIAVYEQDLRDARGLMVVTSCLDCHSVHCLTSESDMAVSLVQKGGEMDFFYRLRDTYLKD
jgi:hypothetical protein